MTPDLSNVGTLEFAVLEHLWQHGPCDVKEAHEFLGVSRGITLNTVQSAFKRLWEKGLLAREKVSHAYIYSARLDRLEFTEAMMGTLVDQIASNRMSLAIEAFVNLADQAGDDSLDQLEALIARRRAAMDDR